MLITLIMSIILCFIFIINKNNPYLNKYTVMLMLFLSIIETNVAFYYKWTYVSIYYSLLSYSNPNYLFELFFTLMLLFALAKYKENMPKELLLYTILFALSIQLIVLGGNHIIVFLGFELMNFVLYLLLSSEGKTDTPLRYYMMSLLGTVCFLYGLIEIYETHGNLYTFKSVNQWWILTAIFLKMGMYPLHEWLYTAYKNLSLYKNLIILTLPKVIYVLIFSKYYAFNETFAIWYGLLCLIFIGISLLGMYEEDYLMRFFGFSGMLNIIIALGTMKFPMFFAMLLTTYNTALIIFMYTVADYNIKKIEDLQYLPKDLLFRIAIILLILLMMGFPPSLFFLLKVGILHSSIARLKYNYGRLLILAFMASSVIYFKLVIHLYKGNNPKKFIPLDYLSIIILIVIMIGLLYFSFHLFTNAIWGPDYPPFFIERIIES